ncbi:MAG: trypsin-like peptidase domain-containing protein [Chlamydiia bacterium]|nr:trypsin-like peptidase domain-containing protein [Chlamydiia bacterium]
MKRYFLFLLIPVWVFGAIDVKDSVVKIYVTKKEYNYAEPWASPTVTHGSGSGFIIEGNRIMTNAHVVSQATYIELHTGRSKKRYPAEVKMIGHDCDLAILEVKDPHFFDGKRPLKFSKRVLLEEEGVQVYGFPIGGDEICVTKGIVSRIELGRYVHSGEELLMAQVDASTNPGNSGGPVLSKGKVVGIAHQGTMEGQNIGYMIPIPIIHHFLEENSENYQGFPSTRFNFQRFENAILRKELGFDEGDEGILMAQIPKNHFFDGVLKKGDILLEFDGFPIDAAGMIRLQDLDLSLPFEYLLLVKHYGESFEATVMRDGERLELKGIIDPKKRGKKLVPFQVHDEKPRYFIYGGAVFQPLVGNLILASCCPDIDYLFHMVKGEVSDERDEVVAFSSMLCGRGNSGYEDIQRSIVAKVNGKKVKNFKDFVALIEEADGPFIVIETNRQERLSFEKREAEVLNQEILERYAIPHDRSEDLR